MALAGHAKAGPAARDLRRHGFSDAADAAFDRIWTADDLDWAALIAISDGARAVVSE